MILFESCVDGTQLGTSLIESHTRSETRKKFRHAMGSLGHHGRSKVMRTADDVGDDLSLLRIWDARLEHADDRGRTLAKLNGLTDHRWISIERRRPETVCQDKNRSGLRAVIFRTNEPPEHSTQTPHLEIRTIDHAADNFARLTQTDQRERDCREVAKLAQRFDLRLEVTNFRHRPSDIFLTFTERALLDI